MQLLNSSSIGRFRSLPVAAAAAILFAATGTFAAPAIPGRITQQGRLLNADGTPATGSVSMVFKVYAAVSGGSALWTETQTVALDSGYFNLPLGSVTAFTAGLFDGSTRYLGVTVGGNAEMTPREEIGSTPYALLATPTSHAANHQAGGSDEIASLVSSAGAIPKAGSGGFLDSSFLAPAGIGTPGIVALAGPADTAAGHAVQSSDPRLADARAASSLNFATVTLSGILSSTHLPLASTSSMGVVQLGPSGMSGLAAQSDDARFTDARAASSLNLGTAVVTGTLPAVNLPAPAQATISTFGAVKTTTATGTVVSTDDTRLAAATISTPGFVKTTTSTAVAVSTDDARLAALSPATAAALGTVKTTTANSTVVSTDDSRLASATTSSLGFVKTTTSMAVAVSTDDTRLAAATTSSLGLVKTTTSMAVAVSTDDARLGVPRTVCLHVPFPGASANLSPTQNPFELSPGSCTANSAQVVVAVASGTLTAATDIVVKLFKVAGGSTAATGDLFASGTAVGSPINAGAQTVTTALESTAFSAGDLLGMGVTTSANSTDYAQIAVCVFLTCTGP